MSLDRRTSSLTVHGNLYDRAVGNKKRPDLRNSCLSALIAENEEATEHDWEQFEKGIAEAEDETQ